MYIEVKIAWNSFVRLSGSTNEDDEDRSSRKHIKMQKSVKFLIKVVKLETIVIIQGEYRGAMHRICNSKYSEP